MGYEISFKTIQRYCKYKRDNLDHTSQYKYRCNKIVLIWANDWDTGKSRNRCTKANCPLIKRLFRLYT